MESLENPESLMKGMRKQEREDDDDSDFGVPPKLDEVNDDTIVPPSAFTRDLIVNPLVILCVTDLLPLLEIINAHLSSLDTLALRYDLCADNRENIKKQRGVLNIKKTKPTIFLFLPKAVFEHVYISTLPHSCSVVKQYKELTTKILSITFLILAFLTIHLGDHGAVNVLISLIVISQLLIKLLHLCLEGLIHGLLSESAYHLSLREIVIHSMTHRVFVFFYIFVLLVHIRGSQTCCFQNTTTVSDTQYRFIKKVGNQQELFLLRISEKKHFF
jgi:hypothetical protein